MNDRHIRSLYKSFLLLEFTIFGLIVMSGAMSIMLDGLTPSNSGKLELMHHVHYVGSHLPLLDGAGLSDMKDIVYE